MFFIKTKKIVISSMLLALSAILSMIKPFALPFGGGITLLSMMPLILIGYIFGIKDGLISALIYSLIQMLLDPHVIAAAFLPGEEQMVLYKAILMCLLDYVLAFSALGLSGLFKNRFKSKTLEIASGAFFATFTRYIMHILSGYILWGSYAEWFFSQEGFYSIGEKILGAFSGNALAFIYSVFYNGLYMIPEIILTVIATPIIYKALKKAKAI